MASSFPGVIAFAFMMSMLVLGTVLRARFGFLQQALVPASLIGGVIGFGLISTDLSFGFEAGDFTGFAFHFFTLSFMSLVLTGKEEGSNQGSPVQGGLWLSVIWTMSLTMQALVGLLVVLAWNYVSGNNLSAYLGLMVTHGFTQGPGQALAFGSLWESEFGVQYAVSFGLIYASTGFLVAFAIGVPIARFALRAGLNTNKTARLDEEFLRGIHHEQTRIPAGRQVTHSANVDSLAFHIGILGVAYVLTDVYLTAVQPLASQLVFAGVNFGVIFSHNLFFVHGLIVCTLLRGLMDRFGYGRFIDNETQRRITGSSVDVMVVAGLMGIEFTLLMQFALPILLVCVAVSAATAALCFGFGRYLRSYSIERSLAIFGCCTGSTGSGILLLRILDPDLSTPVPRELAFFNIAILFLAFHVLTLMAPVLPGISLATIGMVYVVTFVVGAGAALLLSRRTGNI